MTRPRIGVLAPLRHRDFRLLGAGSLVSLLGDGVFRVSIAIQVLAVRNDGWALSLVAAAWATAQFVTLPIGGWAADRFQRRWVMLVADVIRGCALGVLAALSLSGSLALWHLVALGVVVGVGNGLFNPTAMSLVPDLLPGEDLEQGNAFLGVTRPLMLWILGPTVGAALVAVGGPGTALAFDALTFGVSALFLLRMRGRPRAARDENAHGSLRSVRALAEGLAFVRTRPWAWAWIAAAGVSTMLHSGAFEVLLPTLLINDLALGEAGAARALAGAFAAGGAGSVLASAVLGQRGLPRRFLSVLFGCEALALLGAAGYGAVRGSLDVALLGLAVFTLFAITDVIATTLFQRLVPRRMLGRVASIDWMSSVGLAPVGFLVAGPVGGVLGARSAIVVMGLLGCAAVVVLALLPGVRDVEARGALRDLGADEAVLPPRIAEAPGLQAPPPRTDEVTLDPGPR